MSRRVLAGGAVVAGLVIVLVIALRGGGGDADPKTDVAHVEYIKGAAPTSNGVPAVQPYWLKGKTANGDTGAQAQAETPRPELPQTDDAKKIQQALRANHGTRDLLQPSPTPMPMHKNHEQALEQANAQQGQAPKLPTADERDAIKRSARKQSAADQRVPGANVMRETLLKAQCTAPDAQTRYQELATAAEKQAFARRCSSYGFHPQS